MGSKRRPGRPKASDPKTMRLTIHVTPEQFAQIVTAAGDEAASSFVREIVLAEIGGPS